MSDLSVQAPHRPATDASSSARAQFVEARSPAARLRWIRQYLGEEAYRKTLERRQRSRARCAEDLSHEGTA